MKPGDIVSTWSDEISIGMGRSIVVATSRHKKRIEGLDDNLYGPIERWWSITQKQWDEGHAPDEADGPGSFYTDGWGKVWVEHRPIKEASS